MSWDKHPGTGSGTGQAPLGTGQAHHGLSRELVQSESPSRQRGNTPLGQLGQENLYGVEIDIREHAREHVPPKVPVTHIRACACPPVPERFTEARLVSEVGKLGGLCWKFTSPGTDGVPDRIVILPGPHIGFVEVKTTGAKPRALQVHRLAQLDALGVPVFVIDHPDQIPEVLDAIRAA